MRYKWLLRWSTIKWNFSKTNSVICTFICLLFLSLFRIKIFHIVQQFFFVSIRFIFNNCQFVRFVMVRHFWRWNLRRSTIEMRIFLIFAFQIGITDFLMNIPITMLTVLTTVTCEITYRTRFDCFSTAMPTILSNNRSIFGHKWKCFGYFGSIVLSTQ